MDFWALRCLEEIEEAEEQGNKPDKHVTDTGMADTIMDFLFASQDASTASLVWMMSLMADHPHILAKVLPQPAKHSTPWQSYTVALHKGHPYEHIIL